MTYTLTLWVCLTTSPFCTADQDPTGPPTTYQTKSYLACETINARNIDRWASNYDASVWHPRHSCEPSGDDL